MKYVQLEKIMKKKERAPSGVPLFFGISRLS